MRVGTGIILSVLSSSVLAAVIPNYDSHGILLARRTVNPNNKDVLWKRADEERVKFVPSSSRAGASIGESNPNSSSNNRESSSLDQLREYVKKIYNSLKTNWNTRKKKYIEGRDDISIKNAVQKVAEVAEGEKKNKIVLEIDIFLSSTLMSARMTFELFDNKTTTPFLLSIPNSSSQKSLTRAMVKLQSRGKQHTKEHLQDVTRGIGSLTKHPRDVVRELGKIMESISRLYHLLEIMYNQDYKDLISKVKRTNNEGNIEATKTRLSQIKGYRARILKAFNSITRYITKGRVTFKGETPSRFATLKSQVQNRLRIKTKPSTDVTPNQEET
ncbi:hypothetical protein BASA50_007841 [Batrachochytrium salamandrivorans]|uniref:Uncharacterized protein n=1 Tax=Batrachochytrium salamandrivorans TaxID=1357716 RepID=A0ABQ8F935_9FUNG|nr:hypothetical protein BASA60_004460 [Batrachochytrium salamandrivorans]KAH6576839.1 hypothetical protein BASA62_001179 [Batrachochytrium salamandrivorans]KAH6592790.1 hypothetical protein BASA50_007841 [Batrachochytrium salamandrivorans]